MMVTIPQAMASFTGIPRKTRIGIRMLAPPSPVRDPRKPTGMEIRSNDPMLSRLVTGLVSVVATGIGS